MMKQFRKPLLFALALLPFCVIGAYFAALYQLDFLDEATLSQVMEQLGSTGAFIAVYVLQIALYVLVMGSVGCLLAEKLGVTVREVDIREAVRIHYNNIKILTAT